MTLQDLSNEWLGASGNSVGFVFKSTVSGKVFKAEYKTPGGKFFCVNNEGGGEVLLDGTVDRYVMFGGSGRIAEINAEMINLEAQRDLLETQIEALDIELDQLLGAG